MSELEALLAAPPYAFERSAKCGPFREALAALTRHHYARCTPYRRVLDRLAFDPAHNHDIDDYPSLPARLFKHHHLQSVGDDAVRTVMTSSGTGGHPSRIVLDATTASLQTKALSRIVADFIGPVRLPMLVIDAPSTVRSRTQFSARAAGILGFALFGRNITYALNDDMSLNLAAIDAFLGRHGTVPVLLFGFTFVVWRHFIEALEAGGNRLPLDQGILIHGGGWKKLVDLAVDNATFKRRLKAVTGIGRVHNYYGLVEQTGSIYVECEHGRLHCSLFSDVSIRNSDFASVPMGRRGLVQLVSLLPHSYPGHVLLTEDEGTIEGEDDCPCGRMGKHFHVHGRTAQAEVRGCSDAYAGR